MMSIREATENDISLIRKLAHDIWWPTYRDILPADQISLMLEEMYSKNELVMQMNSGVNFLITETEGKATGFAGYSLTDKELMVFKIHKIYLLPSEQGKGTGKKLIGFITSLAVNNGGKILELNVNRSNPAFSFYKKLGFKIYEEVDIPYHKYFLNDYVMRKNL
ncbi:MAG TPA: GNAT family N-acetyltransferase [Sphingobacteriaceae bacterium]